MANLAQVEDVAWPTLPRNSIWRGQPWPKHWRLACVGMGHDGFGLLVELIGGGEERERVREYEREK